MSSNNNDAPERAHKAGAFDIRNFIAMLIGIYGIILIIVGLVATSDLDLKRADNLNINLIAGIGMALVAAFFVIWARLRPVVVPDEPDDAGSPQAGPDAH